MTLDNMPLDKWKLFYHDEDAKREERAIPFEALADHAGKSKRFTRSDSILCD